MGRLGDITHPLLCVAQLLPREASESLLSLIGDMERQRKDDLEETLGGRIARGLYELRKQVAKGRMPVEAIRIKVVKITGHEISSQSLGQELTRMGFAKRIKSNGVMAIEWCEAQLEGIWKRYGVGEEDSPQTP